MAMRVERHPLEGAFEALLEHGLDGAGEALRILVNEASKIERAQYLHAKPNERTPERVDYANGFKPKTVITRVGELTFEVPQVRNGGFYPSALEKGSRTEQAVNLACAEMYVQGVSTRKVITVLQSLLGPDVAISSTQVSRAAEKLDAGLAVWRERPLDETPFLILEARAKVVTNLSQAEAELVLEDTVDPDAHLMSDEWKVFVAAGAGFRAHETVRHSEREYVRGDVHANSAEGWRDRYGKRAGIEGTLSQAVRAFGLRRCRYLGLAKTKLQHVFTAIAINVVRVDAWLTGQPIAKTRRSAFASLQQPMAA